MADEIKVGDVCVVIGEGHFFAPGEEVTVFAGPWTHPVANKDVSFACRSEDGVMAWCYRFKLQKRPPYAAPSKVDLEAAPA
jgi:hypothetical protein